MRRPKQRGLCKPNLKPRPLFFRKTPKCRRSSTQKKRGQLNPNPANFPGPPNTKPPRGKMKRETPHLEKTFLGPFAPKEPLVLWEKGPFWLVPVFSFSFAFSFWPPCETLSLGAVPFLESSVLCPFPFLAFPGFLFPRKWERVPNLFPGKPRNGNFFHPFPFPQILPFPAKLPLKKISVKIASNPPKFLPNPEIIKTRFRWNKGIKNRTFRNQNSPVFR